MDRRLELRAFPAAITIMITTMDASAAPRRKEFDPGGLAATIAAVRRDNGWSTRELARRAGVSQPYVVALERGSEQGPTPTVEVLARLANAFRLDPKLILERSLRESRQHVVLVLDNPARAPLQIVRRASGEPALSWVWAATSTAGRQGGRGAAAFIDLHHDEAVSYLPRSIESALADELRAVRSELPDGEIGIVFAEASRAFASINEPSILLEFERRWDDAVAKALRLVDQRARWNVCVYEVADLLRLGDPVSIIVELCHSHHDLWYSGRGNLKSGLAGATAALHKMRPPGTAISKWQLYVDGIVDTVGFAA